MTSRNQLKQIIGRNVSLEEGPDSTWNRLVSSLQDEIPTAPALRSVSAHGIVHRIRTRYVPALLRTAKGLRLNSTGPGSIYLNVSHYGLEQKGILERVVGRGWRPVVLVHDLIPVTHPEYCSPVAGGWHRRRLDTIIDNAALVICNSENTARELRGFAEADHRMAPELIVSPLGVEDEFLHPAAAAIKSRKYFIVVGTLEPRKNLLMLFSVWRRLAEQIGDATPSLVLVGQRGWESESIIDHLERSPPVRRFVHEANGLQDHQVAQLLLGASALLAPSFKEGFDLPVREARAMGTPVIASDIPIHRELAPDAKLIDPLDGPAWLEAILNATRKSEPRRRRTVNSWKDHFDLVSERMGLPR